ncbi:hypothetical protein [Frigoribacterium sp. UYMn621]|uniref:hypothetical protein n=1 Tax=Frigoribacterium sp. UYMn621 TaxID=3156343 RepID=UPI0033983319
MTKYVKNEEGGIHSVTDEHFETVLHETTAAGRSFLLPGWSEISEADAREGHPQLFGKEDLQVSYTTDELHRALERKRMLDELYGPGSVA